MRKKYSDNFERDYNFYLKSIGIFTFCGTHPDEQKHKAIADPNGKSAKEVFYRIESTGKNTPTCEPELLNNLLMSKASINFHIKMWAEGRADGTLPFYEFAGEGETLHWDIKIVRHKYFWWLPKAIKRFFGIQDTKEPVATYKKSLAVEYQLPGWVIKAVEKQKDQILRVKLLQHT